MGISGPINRGGWDRNKEKGSQWKHYPRKTGQHGSILCGFERIYQARFSQESAAVSAR